MKLEFSVKRFPLNGALKDASGLPFSAVLQPFSKLGGGEGPAGGAAPSSSSSAAAAAAAGGDTGVHTDAIARCVHCYSYINCYCSFDTGGWECAVCCKYNTIRQQHQKRYALNTAALQALPELQGDVYEALAAEPVAISSDIEQELVTGPAPVYVALVDASGGEEFLELVRSSLEAALEALPSCARFMLVSFSNRLGLYDVRADSPSVRYISLAERGPAVPLADIIPLESLLAPIAGHKASITQALEEQLLPDGPGPEGEPAVPTQPSMRRHGAAPSLACRGLGPALLAVLDYLKVLQSPPFQAPATAYAPAAAGPGQSQGVSSPIRLMLFLSGVPDLGAGRLINPNRRRRQQAQRAGPAPPPQQQQPPPSPEPSAAAGPSANGGGAAAADQHPPPAVGATTAPEASHEVPPGAAEADSSSDWMYDVPSSSVEFYEQAGVACASMGVCVDLYAVSGKGLGLRFLQPLCNGTGGGIYLYPSLDESAMPQDVYLRLSSPSATNGILRLRTSPQFKPVRHYGRLFSEQGAAAQDLHHVISMDPSDAFAVDFDFTSPAGFGQPGRAEQSAPTLQVAFQYTTLVTTGGVNWSKSASSAALAAAAAAGDGAGVSTKQYWLQRRLRVATYRVKPATSVRELHACADPDAVLALLLHKIMRAAQVQGLQEARLLLRDWLVILALSYHNECSSSTGLDGRPAPAAPSGSIDLMFTSAPPLASLPRLVYALLRSPMLAPPTEGQHPDLTAFLQHLWGVLPPGELARAVYPLMSSYANPDQQAFPRHSLSRAGLQGPDAPPIFLLDAYILILVYYTARCLPELPFPPPQQSALRKAVAAIRAERRITPQVKVLREGGEDGDLFDQLLLDEPDVAPGEDGATSQGFGLVQFLAHIQSEAAAQLQHNSSSSSRR